MKHILSLGAAMFALCLSTFVATAQDNGQAGNILRELLRGLEGPQQQQQQGGTERRVPLGRSDIQLSFAPLVKQTAPAVVNVYASQQRRAQTPFAGDPFFERFFGGGRNQPRQQSSLGSGVIVDASGIVITNFHVIR